MPVTFFLFITGIIGNLQDFTRYSLVGGYEKANNAYVTVAYYLYHYMDSDTLDLGLACAASWILTFIVLAVTITQFVVNRRQGDTTK
jgi:multiple sugar transport system permease protein